MILTFDVKGAWKGDTIASPASTVGGKPVGLSNTRGVVRTGEVVATADEMSFGGADVLRGEVRVLES